MNIRIGVYHLIEAVIVFLIVGAAGFMGLSADGWTIEYLRTTAGFLLQGLLQFGLTLAGFLITALSILLVFESKPWFDRIRKTPIFHGFVQKIQWTIVGSFLLFGLSLVAGASVERLLQDRSLVGYSLGGLLGLSAVLIFWSISSVKALVTMGRQ